MVNIDDLIGVPYVNGGRDCETGLDCWGLVREYYRRAGIKLPKHLIDIKRVDAIMAEIDSNKHKWLELETPEVGCVVLLRLIGNPLPSHCGIYVGYGEFMHAVQTAVQIDRVSRWGPRVIGYFKPKEGAYPHV
ncbi:C40 family peptidase [Anaeroglobus geminatus]|jgi:cell wall-associated NlpC family hydrolase|uniref:NlpC/P60 family protein n=1 Tax=Anaeroglobus geminatus F0357 TaxID=861450 RepID=G9YK52_9FIRM|nr:NlpC/P60 family protein [Anaeroglobus geminatus]EHM37726.1 NlpC/P60 family protein [Anaeroglobus geminatus F0357]